MCDWCFTDISALSLGHCAPSGVTHIYQSSGRNKDQKLVGHFLEIGYFYVSDCCPTENVQDNWPTKMDFGQPMLKLVGKWPMADCYL